MITSGMMIEIAYRSEMSDGDREQLSEKAELGDADAQYRWGGELYKADKEECAEWWKKAAKQGHVLAQCDLGALYLDGLFVRKDVKYGVALLRRAAESECGCAMYNLAQCYREGEGVKRSKSEYVRLLRCSAKQDYVSAFCDLAWCYREGYGVKPDYDERKRLLLRAAEMGDVSAMYEYSLDCLEPWNDASPDVEEGLKWIHKAAECGDTTAMDDLAYTYAKGRYGVPQNMQTAHYWVLRSALYNHDEITPEEAIREFDESLIWDDDDTYI